MHYFQAARLTAALLLAGLPALVRGAGVDSTWNNANGSDWNTPGNWDNGVPTNVATLPLAVTGDVITNTSANQGIVGIRFTDITGASLTLQSTGSGSFLFSDYGDIRNNTPPRPEPSRWPAQSMPLAASRSTLIK